MQLMRAEEADCLIKILTNMFKFSLSRVFAGGERKFSAWGRIWSKDRNRLLVGRVAMLVYIYFNQRVLNRNYSSGVKQDWDAFLSHLEKQAPIVVPQGNHAAGLPGPSLLAGDECLVEILTPVNNKHLYYPMPNVTLQSSAMTRKAKANIHCHVQVL